jgi:hypothetical protein
MFCILSGEISDQRKASTESAFGGEEQPFFRHAP